MKHRGGRKDFLKVKRYTGSLLDLTPICGGLIGISLYYQFILGKCIWLSCVYFLMSVFDLLKGDIWRVDVVELKRQAKRLQYKIVAILEKLFCTWLFTAW